MPKIASLLMLLAMTSPPVIASRRRGNPGGEDAFRDYFKIGDV